MALVSRRVAVFLSVCCFFIAMPAGVLWAWAEHPLIIHGTLASMPEIRDAKPVKAESLDSFLAAGEKDLVPLLAGEERWARKNLAWYQPLPGSLAFRATGNRRDIRERFCHAIRINPNSRLILYLQYVPGGDPGGRPHIAPDRLTFLQNLSDWKSTAFVPIEEGESVSPLDIVATASDEPDFGLDIGLYEDNGTLFGRTYGLGKQPFGDPALEYGSQAPFHMGYYHEAWIVDVCAPFVRKTYPEERIHVYMTLSRYAFKTGHDYWGWRFMGMGLHYIMDLTQPYHSTLLPGVGTLRMLWINALDIAGYGRPKKDAVQLVSNRHAAIEKFGQMMLQNACVYGESANPVLAALKPPMTCPAWDDGMPRRVISARSNSLAAKADRVMEETMPGQWVSDPAFELGNSPDLDAILDRMRRKGGEHAVGEATALLKEILETLPVYTCSYVRGILSG